ncbi:monothiol glutaredoxin-S10 [Elaeis guineensis]|uniref:Monothiol glutaredoxin-S10 n=1 Tax=Elaeis guineensis var. tenera TaxID=51953 RepID=A0A6J0PPL9_ELAGV|nr:monothiol glutaredoxin-S10 [Elaeis guineensis]
MHQLPKWAPSSPLASPPGPQLQKVLERLTGQYTVPNVFIDTVKLHGKGELTTLLSELNMGSKSLQQPGNCSPMNAIIQGHLDG